MKCKETKAELTTQATVKSYNTIHFTIDFFLHHFTMFAQHYFTISPSMKMCPKKPIHHCTNSPFGKRYKNHCTISPPNYIDKLKSSYHITISPYKPFHIIISPFHHQTILTYSNHPIISPFHHLCPKKIDSPLHHLENDTKIIAPFHNQTTLTYSNHPATSPFHHINNSLSSFHHLENDTKAIAPVIHLK